MSNKQKREAILAAYDELKSRHDCHVTAADVRRLALGKGVEVSPASICRYLKVYRGWMAEGLSLIHI